MDIETEVKALRLQLADEAKARIESDRLYERECRRHDNTKVECLQLNERLQECEEHRGEFVPFQTETIAITVHVLMYTVIFAAALKYVFFN